MSFLRIFCLSLFVSFICINNNVKAVARAGDCVYTDGKHDCDQGLMCDPKVLICGTSNDVPCNDSNPCALGYSCDNKLCVTADGSAESNAFGDALCSMYKFVTGKVGRGVAAGVVISLGVSFFLGKVTWASALAVALGVGAVFGAPSVVSVLTGRSFSC